ncbi:hypothetical protein EYR41_005756 [Orbilia oligospora]|uniref:Uncharacterized protein n=1 Tax=Orbilia oligospora TaxID=2813651 RepID=A0A7C8PPP1_ORBOL|nr:hypothetical protein TWF751_007101 [Orbilia oligospora]KAF3272063.1 hypothetical protein TWF217_003878 [Orbilia oligospora]KAF3297771.1 hypothetical protein TWF132_006168 [Orbilia oligospora]TGJ69737.1 hypothetical protein EYR41_005756 [Orbilia oligospora]
MKIEKEAAVGRGRNLSHSDFESSRARRLKWPGVAYKALGGTWFKAYQEHKSRDKEEPSEAYASEDEYGYDFENGRVKKSPYDRGSGIEQEDEPENEHGSNFGQIYPASQIRLPEVVGQIDGNAEKQYSQIRPVDPKRKSPDSGDIESVYSLAPTHQSSIEPSSSPPTFRLPFQISPTRPKDMPPQKFYPASQLAFLLSLTREEFKILQEVVQTVFEANPILLDIHWGTLSNNQGVRDGVSASIRANLPYHILHKLMYQRSDKAGYLVYRLFCTKKATIKANLGKTNNLTQNHLSSMESSDHQGDIEDQETKFHIQPPPMVEPRLCSTNSNLLGSDGHLHRRRNSDSKANILFRKPHGLTRWSFGGIGNLFWPGDSEIGVAYGFVSPDGSSTISDESEDRELKVYEHVGNEIFISVISFVRGCMVLVCLAALVGFCVSYSVALMDE